MQATGMLLVNKPTGITSFSALGWYKRALGTKRVGHTGTLDKFAEGLMLVLVGSATRLSQFLVLADKTYIAECTFGVETDTLDPEGRVLGKGPVPTESALVEALATFVGTSLQVPPDYSAIHVQGKRAYQRVLDGEVLDLPPREITIYSAKLLSYVDGRAKIEIACSKGTYIRSLARDLARRLGTVGHVSALQRTQVGPFTLQGAHSVDSGANPSIITGLSLMKAMPGLGIVLVSQEELPNIKNGRALSPEVVAGALGEPWQEAGVFDAQERLCGIVHKTPQGLAWTCVFPENIQ